MRHVAARAEVPALHPAFHDAPTRQVAVSVRVEHPVRVARSHALAVEPVPVVEAHRQWVVTELAIEHPVDPAERSFAVADANRHEIRSVENATPDALRPLAALLGTRKDGDQAIAEALLEATHDPGVEEEPDRELVGKDEPDRARHHELPSSASIRPATEAPSSPCAPSASDGVPHAGQPSTPNTATGRPSSLRSASPSPPTGA